MPVRKSKTGRVLTLALCIAGGAASSVSADETHAREILQSMSDHLAGMNSFTVEFDATLEVVTDAGEKLGLARSGDVKVERPDKLRARSTGGYSDLEVVFDGQTMTLFGRVANVFASVPTAGDIDGLVDALRDEHGRPLPAADLLVSDPYAALMSEVQEVKDLGAGYVADRECDHLAFRSSEVDWQIWIETGTNPVPCRFVITARDVSQAPQYEVTFRNWAEGAEGGFEFEAPNSAREVPLDEYVSDVTELPANYSTGDKQ